MSTLSQRFTKRAISKPNARKAIDRIEKELLTLRCFCPRAYDELNNQAGYNQSIQADIFDDALPRMACALRAMYNIK